MAARVSMAPAKRLARPLPVLAPVPTAAQGLELPRLGSTAIPAPTAPRLSPQEQNPFSLALWVVPAQWLGVG